MNTNEARAWKRNRYSDDRSLGGPGNTHIMMKAEAKVMRRLQAETGLSEEEIRKVKKYRVELSEAQTTQEGPSDGERIAKRLLKVVTRELKLAKAHPDVVKAAMESAREAEQESRYRYYSFGIVTAMKTLLGK